MTLIDKDTFCEQIKLHEKAMYFLASSLLQNDADAADVIGEAIFRAYENIDSLKNEEAFKTWILKIIHNTAVEYIRKNTKIILMYEIDVSDEGKEKKDIEVKMSLQRAVKSLKQPYRTVILLHYYEDLSINEISKVTGDTTIAVKQQLSRARKQLREILKEDFGDE